MDNVDLPTQGTANTPTYNTWVGPYNGTLNNKFKIAGNQPLDQLYFGTMVQPTLQTNAGQGLRHQI